MKTLSTKLTDQELNQFKDLCERQISTPSQVARHLIRQYLSEQETTN